MHASVFHLSAVLKQQSMWCKVVWMSGAHPIQRVELVSGNNPCRAWASPPGNTFAQSSCLVNHVAQRVQSSSPNGALQLVTSFWSDIWFRQLPDLEAAWHTWQQHVPQQPVLPGRDLEDVELYAQAQQRSHCAAGCDGWSGEEVSLLPRAAWKVFADLFKAWLQRGTLPTVWRHFKQVHLPKERYNSEVPK